MTMLYCYSYRIGLNLLDELSKQLKEHVRRNIISFVQNMNTNIVLVSLMLLNNLALELIDKLF